jgi:hypothetical protein
MKASAFVALTLCALAASAVGAQANVAKTSPVEKATQVADGDVATPKFVRLGIVYDSVTQEVIANAIVRDRNTGNFVRTSASGHFALTPTFVKETGAYLEVMAPGYEKVGPFLVDPTASPMIEAKMVKVATSLPAMVTTEKYRVDRDLGQREGFAMRCRSGHVDCTDEETLVAHPTWTLYDFIKKAEGVQPWCGDSPVKFAKLNPQLLQPDPQAKKTPATCLAKMTPTSGTGRCTPTYFLNGFEWAPLAGESQIDLSGFSPSQLEGIEVYDSIRSRPMRFGGDPFCGVVVIWTK